MQKAFTMIELIFVIVIIGILSAVAIPKLAATRDDARVSAMADTVVNAANEVAAYSISTGDASLDLASMSNIITSMINQNKATLNAGVLDIGMNTISDCIIFTVVQSRLDMNLTLTYGDAGTDTICASLQDSVNASAYPLPLKGPRIKI